MPLRPEHTPKDVVASQNASLASDLDVEQELAQTRLERNMFRRLWPLLAPVKGRVCTVAALELLLVVSIFARPWLIGHAIDAGFTRGDTGVTIQRSLLSLIVVGLAASWALRFALSGASQY